MREFVRELLGHPGDRLILAVAAAAGPTCVASQFGSIPKLATVVVAFVVSFNAMTAILSLAGESPEA